MWGERAAKQPPGVPINFWSPTLNNVSWSSDGIIAVGGCEHVALLVICNETPNLPIASSELTLHLKVPKFKSVKDDDKEWDSFQIRVNVFSDDEVPLMLPLSWKAMSVGEEQSEAFCTALAWSPPGLGKHRRCVLAVLTANHVLSIWECLGKPDVASDWERVCIVNHALQDSAAHDQTESDRDVVEGRTVRQRIRSFAWSPCPRSSSTTGSSGSSVSLSQPYLAVSNDVGEVFILKVNAPYDLLSPKITKWSTSVIHSFTAGKSTAKKSSLLSCMPGSFQRRRIFVDQLAWSPWARDASGTMSSVLATTIQSSLQCRLIHAHVTANDTFLEPGPALPRIVDENTANTAGHMQWMGKPTADGEMYLLYPCRKILYCIVFHLRKASGIRVTKQPLDNVWDELSGMAFTNDHHNRPVVHLTYNINSVSSKVLAWPLPLTDVQPMAPPPWQLCLKDAETFYSQENESDGHVMTRTYGIAMSPLGDLSAINSSHHPSDGVEYIIASDQMSSLKVTSARETAEDEILPISGGPSHPSEVSAEAALFSLQRILERVHEANSIDGMLHMSLLQTLDLGGVSDTKQNQTSITEDSPIRDVMREMRENILFHRSAIASRSKKLASFSRGEIPKSTIPDADVVRRIVTEVVRMPHFISESSELSQTISHIHDLILAKLDARDGQREDSSGLNDQDVETCGICSCSIAFESLRWARCPNGHQFTRCALSFLSIQTPGTAKFCGICNTQYLNEYLIPDLQPIPPEQDVAMADLPTETEGDEWVMVKQGATAKEPLISLARILFTAVDRCVCCGGKFVG